MSETPEPVVHDPAVAAVLAAMRALSDERRLDILWRFCSGCGCYSEHDRCHCQNDE
jgi:hypothetical protein